MKTPRPELRPCRRWWLAAAVFAVSSFTGRAQFDSGLDDFANQEMRWPINPAFTDDLFTFARLKFSSSGGGGFGFFGRGRGMGWMGDAPTADVMLSFRLHQTTSLAVKPGPTYIDIDSEELRHYPFVYINGAAGAVFDDSEAATLRNYLLNGGFLMMDRFWGDNERDAVFAQMQRLFPGRQPVDLALTHPIFHVLYDFKTKPQMPSAGVFSRFGIFYEPNYDYVQVSHDPHFYAIEDDKGRIMVLLCHNNHFGDGWEHEGDNATYFHAISEGMAYPMFINILFYAMTH